MAAQKTVARHMAQPQQPPRKSHTLVIVLVTLIVLGALGAGGFYAYRRFMVFDVTVNGQSVRVHNGDTVRSLLETGVVNPKPGNLLAVDGSVLEEGKGELCTATINGEAGSVDTVLSANATVQIDDGANTTEDYKTTEEIIPYEITEGDMGSAAYYNGSIHLLSDGQDGKREVQTGTISGKRVEKTVVEPINAGYQIYTARPADRVIALTFDDGPRAGFTESILDILEQNDAKATFFVNGYKFTVTGESSPTEIERIEKLRDQLVRANNMGCQICTHTWDHAEGSGQGLNLTYMSVEEQISEVQRGYESIADVLGEEPKHIMRAPGGNFYGDLITNLWPYVDVEIGWDVDTRDWDAQHGVGVSEIVEAILSVQPGQVVLMHDGVDSSGNTVEALAQALPQLKEQGYSFVTIDELLAYGVPA